MKTYKGSNLFANIPKRSTHLLTIGSYDGVHIGHQKILRKLNKKKEELRKAIAILLTFDPHPRKLFKHNIRLITTLKEKIFLFEKFGLDVCIVEPFTTEYANYDPEKYIEEILVKRIRPDYILVGYDHRFGKQRLGDYDLLRKKASQFHYEAEQMPPVEREGMIVGSSKIRNKIAQGDVLIANDLLGYPFFVIARVIEGKKLGRTLGFPTINLEIPEDKLLPAQGVYAGKVFWEKEEHLAMINIGYAPTTGKNLLQTEAHILNFSGNLYGKEVRLEFFVRLRKEQKFPSLEALKKQLEMDKEATMKFFQ